MFLGKTQTVTYPSQPSCPSSLIFLSHITTIDVVGASPSTHICSDKIGVAGIRRDCHGHWCHWHRYRLQAFCCSFHLQCCLSSRAQHVCGVPMVDIRNRKNFSSWSWKSGYVYINGYLFYIYLSWTHKYYILLYVPSSSTSANPREPHCFSPCLHTQPLTKYTDGNVGRQPSKVFR